MIDLDIYMRQWLRWNKRSDAREVARVGWKASGIEYRIMHEAGVAPKDDVAYNAPNVRMSEMVDFAYCSFSTCGFEEHMKALEIYYLRKKSVKATAVAFGYSRDKTKRLIQKASLMMESAIILQEMQLEARLSHRG